MFENWGWKSACFLLPNVTLCHSVLLFLVLCLSIIWLAKLHYMYATSVNVILVKNKCYGSVFDNKCQQHVFNDINICCPFQFMSRFLNYLSIFGFFLCTFVSVQQRWFQDLRSLLRWRKLCNISLEAKIARHHFSFLAGNLILVSSSLFSFHFVQTNNRRISVIRRSFAFCFYSSTIYLLISLKVYLVYFFPHVLNFKAADKLEHFKNRAMQKYCNESFFPLDFVLASQDDIPSTKPESTAQAHIEYKFPKKKVLQTPRKFSARRKNGTSLERIYANFQRRNWRSYASSSSNSRTETTLEKLFKVFILWTWLDRMIRKVESQRLYLCGWYSQQCMKCPWWSSAPECIERMCKQENFLLDLLKINGWYFDEQLTGAESKSWSS